MEKVAFITYNEVGEKIASGWHERNGHRALVLQNTKGQGGLTDGPIGEANRREQINLLWQELRQQLSAIDHIVVYVGTNGSEAAIALASELRPEQVTFVGCDCNIFAKEMLIQAAGMDKSKRLLCECGGHMTMEWLLNRFLETGQIN